MERQAEARIAGGEWEGGVGVGKEWGRKCKESKRGVGELLRRKPPKKMFLMLQNGSKYGSDACTVAVTCDTSFRRNRCHNVEP